MKKVFGKTMHSIFAVFLIWQSIQLFDRIVSNSKSGSFPDLIVNAILINLFITGIFTIVYSFPIYKILPESYFKITNPKQLIFLNKLFKIEIFRTLLRSTIWNKQNNKKHFFNGTRNGFIEFEENTRKSEFGHFVPFIIITFLTIYVGIFNDLYKAIWIFLLNIILNFHPFILQRLHRMRLNRIK